MPFPSEAFWNSKRVLVTGHTGFKGAWLALYLSEIGANVRGMALQPKGTRNLFAELKLSETIERDSRVDIRDFERVRAEIIDFQPEVVFHLAAQPLVSEGYRFPLETISTNVFGTSNLLEATRQAGIECVFISVATDKVYANTKSGEAFIESDPLGGYDPYSASKASADIISQMYFSAYFSEVGNGVGVARAGNVIGGGDWSEDRLFPDLARAWSSNRRLRMRFPSATRPWQHVLEPLRGYLLLAEKLHEDPLKSGPMNFGPNAEDSVTVEEVVRIASDYWPNNPGWEIDTEVCFHESKDLAVDCGRAKNVLDFDAVWSSATAIERTVEWYREFHSGTSALELCYRDIEHYELAR